MLHAALLVEQVRSLPAPPGMRKHAHAGLLRQAVAFPAGASRAPHGLTPVVKSRTCVASLRCSPVKYVEHSPETPATRPTTPSLRSASSRLGPLATAQFHSVRQTVRCSSGATADALASCQLSRWPKS